MDTPPPPPPVHYPTSLSPPSMTTTRTDNRLNQASFTSPLAARFSPQMSPQNQLPLPLSRSTGSLDTRNGLSSSSPPIQFSTPPGPPIFSSPLQPAAVPFRTSPTSPQPLAFSTSSTIPTFSPSNFTNGTATIPLPDTTDVVEAVEAPYVLFSSLKVLKRKKQANASSLGFGALVSLGREITPGPHVVQRDAHRCQNCGAYASSYSDVSIDSGKWKCVICKKLNSSDGEFVAARKEDLHHWPELSFSTIDYVHSGNRRPGYVPVSDSRMSAPVFLVIDECLDEAHIQHLQGSLHAFVDSLPQNMRIGIITFGRTISIYDFSEGSVASADVLPGGNSPSEDSLKTLIYGTGIYLSPMHASLSVAHTIFSSLSPYRIKLPEVARDRCLGAAVEVAMAIIQGPSADMSRGIIKKPGGNCRILVCTGGPNTYGPGSVPSSLNHPNYPYMEKRALKWMEHLGQMAHRNNIIVDILCAGTCPVRVPVLQPLARSSGGVLLLHDDFGEAFGVNLQRAALRAAGSHGLFEIRCSDDILVTQVIGPGEEALADNHESFKNDSSYCIQMHCVEETQSFSLSMETKGDIQHDSVYFQFALRYWNAYQADISRVITVRLPTVDSVSQYLESIQEDVVSVLIAKRTLLHAKTAANAIDMRMTVDERIKDIASRFGLVQQRSKLLQFPKELSKLPEVLFHLRRGPLLGSIVGHEDERSVLRNIFLHASYELSLRMLAPRCLMHREGGTFEELPSYDLSMQSNAALVLDHGTDIFIWLGNELTADEVKSSAALAACLTLAEELSEQRFPAPKILSFREGSSQARYLASRLIPAHKDPPYEQEARFPQLQMLSSGQRARLKASFIHNDDPSFCEWMRSLKLVPPEPS